MNSVLTGVVAALALNLALWRLWLPVEYELGASGIVEQVLGRRSKITWKEIGGYEATRRGVHLFPKSGRTRLLASRSLYIRAGRRQQQLCEMLEFYLAPHRLD